MNGDTNRTRILKNNILSNSRTGGSGNHYAIFINSINQLTQDFNIYSAPKTGYYNSAYTTLADWQTAVGQDANSKSFTPNFTSANDLHLNLSSVNQDYRGTPIAEISTDIDNDTRHSQYPYIGADEKTGNLTLPVTLSSFTALTVSSGSVMLSWTTQSETNMMGYHVYRSENNQLSESLRISDFFIPARNQSTETHYQFTDENIQEEHTYYYWLSSYDLDGSNNYYGPVMVNTHHEDPTPPVVVSETCLHSAFPNPANPSTMISFDLTEDSWVDITLYNIKGQAVRKLTSNLYQKGKHQIIWNGNDDQGKACSTGIYFCQMKSQNYQAIRKIMILK